jgi:hypothetical protein
MSIILFEHSFHHSAYDRVPGRTHKAYFPTAYISTSTNPVLLMLNLGSLGL